MIAAAAAVTGVVEILAVAATTVTAGWIYLRVKRLPVRVLLDAFRTIPARRVKIEDPPGCAECRRKDRLIRILMQDHHDPRL
jgi:hypothetical protein